MEFKGYSEWKDQLMPVLKSKIDEYRILGYESVTVDELWECSVKKAKKKRKEDWRIHEVVSFILSISVNDFMNWLTLEAMQNDHFFASAQNIEEN